MKALLVLLWLTFCATALALPIRIDSSRNGRVYVRVVGEEEQFREISDKTPVTFDAKPGQRVDVRVVAQDGFLWTWSGTRQATTGPSNVTVRLEKSLAWGRLAAAAGGTTVVALLGLLGWRRRTAQQIAAIEKRAQVAESGTGTPKRIAGYSILEEIGEGGMAHVYRGQDEHGVDYAIKVPKTVDERFLRECTIATTLESPHIVKGYDFRAEKSEGQPAYLAQEYLTGETLEDRLKDSKGLDLEELDQLCLQLLEGLEAAHQQSILHRDLKPENLFLDRSRGEDILKILDFGVAKADDALLMTVSGQMLGTALYASPEQNKSDKLDQRSDLYSVGLILYEMATGERTWNATNRYELIKLHNAGLKTQPGEEREDLPPEWNDVICALLKTDREKRPNDVAEVRRRWESR